MRPFVRRAGQEFGWRGHRLNGGLPPGWLSQARGVTLGGIPVPQTTIPAGSQCISSACLVRHSTIVTNSVRTLECSLISATMRCLRILDTAARPWSSNEAPREVESAQFARVCGEAASD